MVFTKIEKKLVPRFDWGLILGTLVICAMGLVTVYSAGYDHELKTSHAFHRQLFAMLGGFVIFLACMLINTNVWKQISYPAYIFGCILLVAVLAQGVVAGGARRWLFFAGVRMQPSEFTKIMLILALAKYCSNERFHEKEFNFKGLIGPGLILFAPFALILDQPDLGTALGHLLIGGSIILVAGVRRSTLIKITAFGFTLLVPVWNFMLKEYQKQRVLTFLNPEQDPLGSGYHAMQSKIAVGSGMITGKGFMLGTQTQLRFLPEQTTDFIFSVLAEEWGFIGATAVVLAYLFVVLRLIKIASRCAEPYQTFVSVGVAAMMFWQMFMNIGMVIGMLPVVGLTLPLFSYGRSSVYTILVGLGIVAGFRLKRFLFA